MNEIITFFRQNQRKDVFFMSSNPYEHFRTVLTMNLCQVLDADQLAAALEAVDVSLSDFEITRKRMELITADGVPDVVKCYIAAKHVASCSTGTLRQYRYRLFHFFNKVRKSYIDITANDIRLYLYTLRAERHVSDHYLETIRVILSGFFRWLVDNDYIAKSPCVKVERIHFNPKRRKALSPLQLEELRWNTNDVREKALIDFFFSSGIRPAECAAVRLSDIDWENRSVRIPHGKGDKERIVYFNAEAEVSIRKYLASRDDDTDSLFVSVRKPHGPIGVHALENIVKKAAANTGVHVYPYCLRHSFATAGLRGGMALQQLQALMGHAKPETTMIYADQYQAELQLQHQRVYA